MGLKYNDRVVGFKNNYIRFMGNLGAMEYDLEILKKGGIQLKQQLEALIEEETQKGNDTLKVFPDLLDLSVLADRNRFTDGIREAVSMSIAMSDNASALSALGFTVLSDWSDFNVASAQVSTLLKKVAFKLYHNLVAAIKSDTTADDMIIDMVLGAIEDQISERMNFHRFCDKFKIALTEENEDKLRMSYDGRYSEWVTKEAERLLEELISNPLENVIIDPAGIEPVKEKLYEVCPPEANEWIDSLTPDDVYGGEVFEKLLHVYKLEKAQLQIFAKAVEQFLAENQTDTPIQLGQGQQSVNPFYSLNLPSVILHLMIIASSELWGSDDELEPSEYTEYIVDAIREELMDITTLEYDADTTPYKILSVMANVNALLVSRSALTRSSSQDYIIAQGAIGTMIQRELMEVSKQEQQEGGNN